MEFRVQRVPITNWIIFPCGIDGTPNDLALLKTSLRSQKPRIAHIYNP